MIYGIKEASMRTGIFFYYQKGERLRDFPQALKGFLEKENVFFYDAFYPSKPPSSFELDPISSEMLYQIHSRNFLGSRPIPDFGCFCHLPAPVLGDGAGFVGEPCADFFNLFPGHFPLQDTTF
jgi:hypothetical protein